MNRKTLWKPLSLLSLFVAVLAQAQDPIQFDRVNTAMDIIANAVVFGDNQVDYAKPKFDEKVSDLKAERIKYDLTGSLKNSPWRPGTRSDVVATTTVSADRNPVHMGIVVTSHHNIKTDFLSLYSYGSMVAWKNLKNPRPKFEARIKDALIRGTQVRSLKDVYENLLTGKQLSVEITQSHVDDAQAWLSCLKAGTCGGGSGTPLEEQIRWAEKRLNAASLQHKSFDKIQIIPVPSVDDVQKIVLKSTSPEGFLAESGNDGAMATLVTATIDNNQIDTEIDGFVARSKDRLDRLHAKLETRLIGLQTGEAKSKDKTFNDFSAALAGFKDVINGDLK
jgi:hypothetical protein